jgi:hypothetical protein
MMANLVWSWEADARGWLRIARCNSSKHGCYWLFQHFRKMNLSPAVDPELLDELLRATSRFRWSFAGREKEGNLRVENPN